MAIKTIIVEDRLKEIFSYLNPVLSKEGHSFEPTFKSGDELELLAFFRQSTGNSNYPLVWLDMPFEEEHFGSKRVKVDSLKLVLAVETNSAMLNSERNETTFKPILYPLMEDIIKVLNLANTVTIERDFKVMKFPNYSNETAGDENGFTDIWDAIRLTLNCTFNNNCLREIKN